MIDLTKEKSFLDNLFKYRHADVERIKKEFYNNKKCDFTDIIYRPNNSFGSYKKIEVKVKNLTKKLKSVTVNDVKNNKLARFKRVMSKIAAIFLGIVGSLSLVGIPVIAYMERKDGAKPLQHLWLGSKVFFAKEEKNLEFLQNNFKSKERYITAFFNELNKLKANIDQRSATEINKEIDLYKRINEENNHTNELQKELHEQLSVCAKRISQLMSMRAYVAEVDRKLSSRFAHITQ